MHVLHLEAQVTLTDEALLALVDLLDKNRVDDDSELFSLLVLRLKNFHALANRLVVVNVGQTGDEVSNVELLLQFQV